MLEKVIENWLDKAGEKTFQEALCAMLAAEGHTIVHLTRHCAMEMGKDVLTIAPDGVPCAFQLKGNPGSRLSLSQWREEVSKQVFDLVVGKIVHPSIDQKMPHHRAYLVTNGDIEEEVSRAIDDMNRKWADQGQCLKLETLVRGQLLSKAKALGSSLWPSELTDSKTLLEIFLSDGKSPLLRDKLVQLLESMFLIKNPAAGKTGEAAWSRVASSAALLCAVTLTRYKEAANHVAEIEAWTIYLGYLFATVDRFGLKRKIWKTEAQIALDAIYNSLHKLYEEVSTRKDFTEGDPLLDKPYGVYRVRMTSLVGLMGIFYLWRREINEPLTDIDKFVTEFCEAYSSQMFLSGESAIPLFLSAYWTIRSGGNSDSDTLLANLLTRVVESNQPGSQTALPSPFYLAEDLMPYLLNVADEPLDDSFSGSAYTLEPLMHLCVRQGKKQLLQNVWPDITRVGFKSFEYTENWQFYMWRNETGANRVEFPEHTQQWASLFATAAEDQGTTLPPTLKEHPFFFLLFLTVFPFRMNSPGIRWLDKQLNMLKSSAPSADP